jgi:hypothetical protein
VCIGPKLINRGDMIELQLLSAGQAPQPLVGGRVANLEITVRRGLPYPPGSGPEGEMLGFDRFVWYVFMPAGVAGAGVVIGLAGNVSSTARVLILIATAFGVGVLYPLRLRYLVRRRRLWRP